MTYDHSGLWTAYKAAGFSWIWQSSPEHADTFWDGIYARVSNVFEALETFGLFLVVPRQLRLLRNFGLLGCDPLLARSWQRAARVYAVCLCALDEVHMPKVLNHVGIGEREPTEVDWFRDGLQLLVDKGLVTYDGETIHISDFSPEVCRPRSFLEGGFPDEALGLSKGIGHPSTGRVDTHREYTEDLWIRREFGGLGPSR